MTACLAFSLICNALFFANRRRQGQAAGSPACSSYAPESLCLTGGFSTCDVQMRGVTFQFPACEATSQILPVRQICQSLVPCMNCWIINFVKDCVDSHNVSGSNIILQQSSSRFQTHVLTDREAYIICHIIKRLVAGNRFQGHRLTNV